MAFISTLDDILRGNRRFASETQYCIIHLAFELRHLLFKGLKVPNKIVRINYKISSTMDFSKIKLEVEQYLSSPDEIDMSKIQ